jgi:hypothetical protein
MASIAPSSRCSGSQRFRIAFVLIVWYKHLPDASKEFTFGASPICAQDLWKVSGCLGVNLVRNSQCK